MIVTVVATVVVAVVAWRVGWQAGRNATCDLIVLASRTKAMPPALTAELKRAEERQGLPPVPVAPRPNRAARRKKRP